MKKVNREQKIVFSILGIGFSISIVFLILKIAGLITWGWLYIALPAIIVASFILVPILVIVILLAKIDPTIFLINKEDDKLGEVDDGKE